MRYLVDQPYENLLGCLMFAPTVQATGALAVQDIKLVAYRPSICTIHLDLEVVVFDLKPYLDLDQCLLFSFLKPFPHEKVLDLLTFSVSHRMLILYTFEAIQLILFLIYI